MPATRYKIWQVGKPVGEGASQSFHVGVAGIAKRRAETTPYVVANELICASLARSIFLPIPPGFIVEHEATPCFVSLNFNLAGEDLPPATPGAVVAQQSRLASGIVLFDIWIVNPDRHSKNIAHDRSTGRVQVFDHSHAFFRGGRVHLEANRDSIGIGGHCLAPEIVDYAGVMEWNDRIGALPDFVIRESIEAAVQVGLPEADKDFCAEFLLKRREQLLPLILKNRQSFPKLQVSVL